VTPPTKGSAASQPTTPNPTATPTASAWLPGAARTNPSSSRAPRRTPPTKLLAEARLRCRHRGDRAAIVAVQHCLQQVERRSDDDGARERDDRPAAEKCEPGADGDDPDERADRHHEVGGRVGGVRPHEAAGPLDRPAEPGVVDDDGRGREREHDSDERQRDESTEYRPNRDRRPDERVREKRRSDRDGPERDDTDP